VREKLREEFEDRTWAHGGRNPRSGRGSNMRWTQGIRTALPQIFEDYKVKTFLDAPCGDWFWMQHVDLSGVTYIGGDISKSVVNDITKEHARPGVKFLHLDVTSDKLPNADMMMCRDCLFHLSFEMRWEFYKNFVKSNIPYLLSTVNYNAENKDLSGPGWEPYNPFLPPFEIGAPLQVVQERGRQALHEDWRETVAHPKAETFRSMAIWGRDQIVDLVANKKD